jgi:1-aminocyclopropane-1-carboxylate deaminase/D-cysteine desulfhydrase-like pyridoxal-dependent ACC family enzyme
MKLTISELARNEGVLLDPVYTARAFYGMLDYLNEKEFLPTLIYFGMVMDCLPFSNTKN